MTKKILHILPVPVDQDALDNFAKQLPEGIVDPGVQVEFVAPKQGPRNMLDSEYERAIGDVAVLAVGASVGKRFDAVVVSSMSDSGLRGLRSLLEIPVVGAGQTAFMVAKLLGERFAVITMWRPWHALYTSIAAAANLTDRLVSIRDIDTRPDAENLLNGGEETVFPQLLAAGRAAIKDDNAEVLVLGSTTMHQAHGYLATNLDVPVINPGVVAHQFAQLLLRAGLTHSSRSYPPPAEPVDHLLSNFAHQWYGTE